MTTKTVRRSYRGRNAYRLQQTDSKNEAIFAKEWKNLNLENPRLLKEILGEEPTDEQVEILSTFAQWLGSPTGFKFCDQTIRKCIGIIK